jgi:anti-sigma-K factor RskA
MTTPPPLPENHDCGGDAAAYVLGALDPPEAEAFRRHLATCVVCRDEVSAFTEVAKALPLTAPQQPVPSRLRARVMRAARTDPGWVAARADVSRAGRPGERRRRPLRFSPMPRLALASTAVVVAALAVVGGLELGSSRSSGARVIQASVSAPGAGAELRLAGGRAELIVRHMPAPPAGRIYEVWLQRGHGAPSPTSTLFDVTSTGTGDVGLPGNLRGISTVMVTAEPTGGSLVPTRAPVIVARLS